MTSYFMPPHWTPLGRRRIRATFSALSVLLSMAVVSCGGDEKSGGGGTTGSGNGTTGIDITGGTTDTGTTGSSIGNSDGGRIDLTEDQVRSIDAAACTGWVGEGETLPAVLQLVVDTSRSMTENAPGSNQSKWAVTRDALLTAMGTLPASVSVGVMFYPNTPDLRSGESSPSPIDACVEVNGMIPIGVLGNAGSQQRQSISSGINGVNPNGYTPTYDAYRYALESSLIPYAAAAKKFMLLITDGAPTVNADCVATGNQGGGGRGGGAVNDAQTQPIIDEIAGAFTNHDIRTFLIGSPGSEQSANGNGDMRPWLSEAAIDGGTASSGCTPNGPDFCHLDMTQEPDFAAALTAGLASVTGQIVNQCEFQVPAAPDGEGPIDPNKTNLIIQWGDGSSSLILPDGQGDCTDGWQWNSDAETVSLCGATCDEIKMDEGASVQLTFGCATDEIITR